MMYTFNDKSFVSIADAKKYAEDHPFWCEAIQKGGMSQTIWDDNDNPVCQRQAVVKGIGCNLTVTMTAWYNL